MRQEVSKGIPLLQLRGSHTRSKNSIFFFTFSFFPGLCARYWVVIEFRGAFLGILLFIYFPIFTAKISYWFLRNKKKIKQIDKINLIGIFESFWQPPGFRPVQLVQLRASSWYASPTSAAPGFQPAWLLHLWTASRTRRFATNASIQMCCSLLRTCLI